MFYEPLLTTALGVLTNPKELAVRRSELAAQLGAFDEKERLEGEIGRLKQLRVSKTAPINREVNEPAKAVATMSSGCLASGGSTTSST